MHADDCPACKGVGYFRSKAPLGDPNFGRAEACRSCDGYGTANRYERALREESGIPLERADEWTLDLFDPLRSPSAMDAYTAVNDWCTALRLHWQPFLVLWGSVGTGKTHLAVGAAQSLISDHIRCYFTTVPRLLEDMRETQRPNATRSLAELRRMVEDVPALVLDDLGADRQTDFATEQLFLVIDRRWQEKRRTFITSNVDLDTLEARIRSRITDKRLSRVVKVYAPDQRLAAQS